MRVSLALLSRSLSPLVLMLGLAASASGCMVAAAGAVEVAGHKKYSDPMGNDFDGADGTLGWRSEIDGGVDMVSGFAYGAHRIGCNMQRDATRLAATCPERVGEVGGVGPVTVFAFQQERVIYRLCAKGTPRMNCRMTWEKIHDGMKAPAPVYPTGYMPPAATVTPAPAPSPPPDVKPEEPKPEAPPTSDGGWF